MKRLVDLVYAVIATLTAPVWLIRMIRTGKIRTDWAGRLGYGDALPPATRPRVLFHAVSVGEVNAIRRLVDAWGDSADSPDVVISTTTDTGYARAVDLFGDAGEIVRFPFDFSSAVRRLLDRVRPDAVALFELEVWPNFTATCAERGIPVCVINGRLTARSFRRYRWIRPLIRSSFQRLAFAAVQDRAYAERFIAMGVPEDRVLVTGTMKWDTAEIVDHVDGADELAAELGIDRSRPLIVAGSTAPGEHELLRDACPDNAQLLCAPRKPEWFEQAARALPGCVRRTKPGRIGPAEYYLLDTIGELRKAYALADIVVVGRTFGKLYGSDMMEPVALGKPTIIGPAVGDFQETAEALLAGDGIVQTTADRLADVLVDLLADATHRRTLAANGRRVVRGRQGATARHSALITDLLRTPPARK